MAAVCDYAQESVTFDNIQYWTPSELAPYVGKTIRLTQPWFVNQVSGGGFYGGPRRLFSPTNQALPGSEEYEHVVRVNNAGLVRVSGLDATPRMGEMLTDMSIKVNSTTSVEITNTPTRHYTYEQVNTPPSVGNRDEIVLVCGMNLCYFLVENLGSGSQGPTTAAQQQRQYDKILDALAAIGADIYGLVEVEQGQGALEKLSKGLSQALGRTFTYINDGLTASGTWTKAGYIYCSDRIERVGNMIKIDTGVSNRKRMQVFRDKKSGETFVFSINHFKAKAGNGGGADSDQDDGQGQFNYSRTQESKAVLKCIESNRTVLGDPDILVMGDLNAYAKEDPILAFTNAGYKDLHQVFHADTSYSYVYTYGGYTVGYLDHALASPSMAAQVTGMAAWHINSDEPASAGYRSSNSTKFRSSDHDPILVGLKPGDYHANDKTSYDSPEAAKPIELTLDGRNYILHGMQKGYIRIYSITGVLEVSEPVNTDNYVIPTAALMQGIHIINAYGNHNTLQEKIFVK